MPDNDVSSAVAEPTADDESEPVALPIDKVDNAPLRPPPTPTDVEEITHGPRTERDEHAPAGLEGAPGSTALAAFLRFDPFTAFFCWLADAQFPAHHLAEVRVSSHREKCPRFYWTCVVLDMVVTLLAVIGLLVLAAAVAYKAVWVSAS